MATLGLAPGSSADANAPTARPARIKGRRLRDPVIVRFTILISL
jgi:hypothetical protein